MATFDELKAARDNLDEAQWQLLVAREQVETAAQELQEIQTSLEQRKEKETAKNEP